MKLLPARLGGCFEKEEEDEDEDEEVGSGGGMRCPVLRLFAKTLTFILP